MATGTRFDARTGQQQAIEVPAEQIDTARPTLAQALAARRRAIYEEAGRRCTALVERYPRHERETWPDQRAEADAYTADPAGADTPTLNRIADRRGISLADLVDRIHAKVAAYRPAIGDIVGCQNSLEDQLQAAEAAFDAGTATEAETRTAIAAIDPADPLNWPAE